MAADNNIELELNDAGFEHVGGADESGVGCLAADVYAAAVILPNDIDYKALMPGLNDSKKKTDAQRRELYVKIKECALDYCVATASVAEIDDINIYWAKLLAFRRAVEGLSIRPDYIIIDGNKEIPEITIPQRAIVKGDGKSISIAAASILAKIDRDDHILELAKLVRPDYEWVDNKSYWSEAHVRAIKKHGKTKWHREKYVAKYFEQD